MCLKGGELRLHVQQVKSNGMSLSITFFFPSPLKHK